MSVKTWRLSAAGHANAPVVSQNGLRADWRTAMERQGLRVLAIGVTPATLLDRAFGFDIFSWEYVADITVSAPAIWSADAVRLAVETAGSEALGWFGGPAPVVTIPGLGEPTQERPAADPSGLGSILGEAKTLLIVAVVGVAVVAVAVGFGPGLRR